MRPLALLLVLVAACAVARDSRVRTDADPDGHAISERTWHLGNDATPEWTEAAEQPEGTSIEVEFDARAFEGEGILTLRQRSVDCGKMG